MPIDLSNVSIDELMTIHNEVLRNLATQAKSDLARNTAVGHDSHGSNHSNNKITDFELQKQVTDVFRKQR